MIHLPPRHDPFAEAERDSRLQQAFVATEAKIADHVGREETETQLARILSSSCFRSSSVLQSFLSFVVLRTLDGQENTICEQSIAVKVFCKESFDSTADTVVRTQAYRLRQKLKEYYAGEGATDSVLIEVPKGHYRPQFGRCSPVLPPSRNEAVVARPRALSITPRWRFPLLLFVAMSLIFGAGVWIGSGLQTSKQSLSKADASESPVDRFWLDFLGPDKTPIVAYSNDLYLATGNQNLLSFSGPAADRGVLASREIARQNVPDYNLFKQAGPLYFEDDKTDIGEVVSASAITADLVRVGARPILKRGRLITTYDLELHNVIFLGSSFANEILKQLTTSNNFVFLPPENPPYLWRGKIYNSHPENDEGRSYEVERDPKSQALLADYAVVSTQPGPTRGKKILILAGLTTSGTQAAAQFVTSVDGIEEMGRRVRQGKSASTEYLLKVSLDHGLDVLTTRCIASRQH